MKNLSDIWHNVVVVVPTKALINEIRIKITKEDLGEILHQKNYHVVTAAGDAELAWYNTPELFLEEDS